jgi:tetratricopeptide (TPR) repeat protein
VLFASIGFGQAFETLSVVASSWTYSEPVLFEELFQSLPPVTSEEQMSHEERGAWGEVFLAESGNTKDPALKEDFGRKAFSLLSVFRDSTDEFKRQRFAKSQLELGDFEGAAETLEKTVLPARKEWWHYWRGKAYAGLKEYSEAVEEFDAAIEASRAPRSAFFASRAEARAAMFDSKCIQDFETAIEVGVDNEEYETFLREQLRVSKLQYKVDSSTSG